MADRPALLIGAQLLLSRLQQRSSAVVAGKPSGGGGPRPASAQHCQRTQLARDQPERLIMIGLTRQLLLRCLIGMIVLLAVGCERKAPEPELPDVPVVEPMESLTAVDPLQHAATEAIWNTGLSLLEEELHREAEIGRAHV